MNKLCSNSMVLGFWTDKSRQKNEESDFTAPNRDHSCHFCLVFVMLSCASVY